ncbi:hypothetical protein [Streptomyces sp. NPDC058249]|uniref:hypothetical protein n=1 Tax=Streptomyces sp. NPDC058249 TaxID=3346403 RepID=UPI0036EC2754
MRTGARRTGGRGVRHRARPGPGITLRGVEEPYPPDALEHRFRSVDASEVSTRGNGPAGARSDHPRPESAHLLLPLADRSR